MELHAYAHAATESIRTYCNQDNESKVQQKNKNSEEEVECLQNEVNRLKEELKSAHEDLRRDEIIFQRKTAERIQLQEHLASANAQIEALQRNNNMEHSMMRTRTTNIVWSDTQRVHNVNDHDDDIVQYVL